MICYEAQIFPWKKKCLSAPPYIWECYPKIPSKCPKIEKIILEILQNNPPMNTSQLCRMFHGAKRNEITFCRKAATKITDFRDNESHFNPKGGLYPNCSICKPVFHQVYRVLTKMEREGKIESIKDYVQDPQKSIGRKDNVRIWSIELPKITKYIQ